MRLNRSLVETIDSTPLPALRGARAARGSTALRGAATAGAQGSVLARLVGAMGVAIGPDDILELTRVLSPIEGGAENPVRAAILSSVGKL
jgi:hypothetical protein